MRILVSLSLALLALGVQPSSGLSFQHLIRTNGRDGRLSHQEEGLAQTQVKVVDPKLPTNPDALAFYNDPKAGDITLVETAASARETSYKVGDSITAKAIDREKQKPVMYQFTLGACLQRKKTWKIDGIHLGTQYRTDSALTTIHDFFANPMEAVFRIKDAADNDQTPNPYATVVDRKWFPDGDYTRIQFKPRAECTCSGAKSGTTKWKTMADFQKHMNELNLHRKIDNAYFTGAASVKEKKFHFDGAVKKLELDPNNNNHPRGSVTSYDEHNGRRTSYDQSSPLQHDNKAPQSIDMFNVKVESKHGDSGAGLYIKQLDKQGKQIPNEPDLFIGILSGATDDEEYTKFTPVWNIAFPANYEVC